MPTFDETYQIFKDNGCELYTTNEEYDLIKRKFAGVMKFKACCQHDNTVTLTNFIFKKSGLNCKNCMYKNVAENLRQQHIDSNENSSKFHIQEYEGYKKISSYIESEFDIERTNEGCLSDMLIKPKYEQTNKWMMVQVKTTKDICHGLYTFAIHENNYVNCIVICICIEDEKMWVLDHTQVLGKKKLNIGLTSRSEYYEFQIKKENLIEKFHYEYAVHNKFNIFVGKLPISISHQQEQIYRRHRETTIPYLKYRYPNIENREYDFYINTLKIQEKVSTKMKDKKTCYIVGLHRSCKGEQKQKCYNKGDNDFYWVWLNDNKSVFYIFPEEILVKKEYIQVDNNLNNKKKAFCISIANWTNDYKYNIDDKHLESKMKLLFNV